MAIATVIIIAKGVMILNERLPSRAADMTRTTGIAINEVSRIPFVLIAMALIAINNAIGITNFASRILP
ncbi:MAG: hypothetical protein Fur0017_02560 [Anaerolineales bacterium]